MRPQGETPTAAERRVRELAAQPGPFRWIQVNRNPGHVYFSHRAHTGIGGMTCAECHGDATAWTEPPRTPVPELHDMDACMDCHRERRVSNECGTCHR
jgi:c(7)-type cytochrome triheme protein